VFEENISKRVMSVLCVTAAGFETWPRNLCLLLGEPEMLLLKLVTFCECKGGARLVSFLCMICECISCLEESAAEALFSWEFQQVASWVLLAEMLIHNTGI